MLLKTKFVLGFVVLGFLIIALPLALLVGQNTVFYQPKADFTIPTVFFSPNTTTMPPDGTLDFILDTVGQNVTGLNTTITFDPAALQLISTATPSGTFPTINSVTSTSEANTTGHLSLSLSTTPDTSVSGTLQIISLPFHAVSTTPNLVTTVTATIADTSLFGTDSAQIAVDSQAATLTLNPVASNSGTPAPTEEPTNNIDSVTMHLKLAGINSDRGPINVAVKIGRSGSSTPLYSNQTVAFLADDQGIYTARLQIAAANLQTGSGYWLAIKGEKHLQRVFTNIDLNTTNEFNLTNKILLPGDLPSQDGIVDANDIDLVLGKLTHPIQTVSDLDAADVNYDGVINSVDLSLILQTLSNNQDETGQ
jgi:hypothetical protein